MAFMVMNAKAKKTKAKKTKITYIITLAEIGGAQSNLCELLSQLHNRFELSLIVSQEGYVTDVAGKLGVPVFLNRFLKREISVINDIRAFLKMNSFLRKIRPDIVHLHSSKAGIIGRLSCSYLSIPAIFTAHGWGFTEGVPSLRRYIALFAEKLVGPCSCHIITVSEYDRKLALKYKVIEAGKISVIHNCIADLQFERTISAQRIQIVMVARFAHPKNHDVLFNTLKSLEYLKWELQLVGDGPLLADCKRRVEDLGLSSRIHFQGAHSQVPLVLANSHIFVLTSQYEGFPICIVEAMRAALPIIASNVGGVSEAVTDWENGYLVPSDREDLLRKYLEILITNEVLRSKMGTLSRIRFESDFTSVKMTEKTISVYEKCLK